MGRRWLVAAGCAWGGVAIAAAGSAACNGKLGVADTSPTEGGAASDGEGSSSGSPGSGEGSSSGVGGSLTQLCWGNASCSNGSTVAQATLWEPNGVCTWTIMASAGPNVFEISPGGVVVQWGTPVGTWSGTWTSYDITLDAGDGGVSTFQCTNANGGVGTDCTTQPCAAPLVCCASVNECTLADSMQCPAPWVACTRSSDCADGGVCCGILPLESGPTGTVCRTACKSAEVGPMCNIADPEGGLADCPGPPTQWAECLPAPNSPASLGSCIERVGGGG